jgi:hypothetical protein
MKHYTLALTLVAACMTAPAAAEPHLNLYITADEHVIVPGDSVNWQIWAELIDPQDEIAVVVETITFNLSFVGLDGLQITDHAFTPSFSDSLLLSNPGIASGDTITGAGGSNPALDILWGTGGPDDSNPIIIYNFTTVYNGSFGTGTFTPLIFLSSLSGAYATDPFPTSFDYSDVGTHPVYIHNDTVILAPTPATSLIAIPAIVALRRRSR